MKGMLLFKHQRAAETNAFKINVLIVCLLIQWSVRLCDLYQNNMKMVWSLWDLDKGHRLKCQRNKGKIIATRRWCCFLFIRSHIPSLLLWNSWLHSLYFIYQNKKHYSNVVISLSPPPSYIYFTLMMCGLKWYNVWLFFVMYVVVFLYICEIKMCRELKRKPKHFHVPCVFYSKSLKT